ncbi:hybrid histidine kinase [Flammeovirgaceae bacterium 311]|nr:hybrid histidine kinase [Flammeovirgaceae bacterium 311]
MANCSKDLTFVYDLNLHSFAFLSDSANDFFGIPTKEIYNDPAILMPLLQLEDRQYVLEQIDKLRNGATYIDTEFRLFMPDQTIKWLHAKAYTLYNTESEGFHVAGIVEDITKRKEHEISLYTIKEQKDTVLQILGHDLRNPLNTISAATELINKQISEESKVQVKKLLYIIASTSNNALKLINDVLNVEYIETQKVALKKLRFDLIDRIQNQIDTYRLIGNTEKDFILHAGQDKIYATMDPTRYMLIVENLLSNAYKFTKSNGRIEVTVEEKDSKVLISVMDDGIGIPEKLKSYIFDKFSKARRAGH